MNDVSVKRFQCQLNDSIVILFIILILGILVGALCYNSLDNSLVTSVSFSAGNFIELHSDGVIGEILINSVVSSLKITIIAFIAGFCAVGQPFEIMLPFFRGLGFGAIVAQVYSQYRLKGVLIIALLLLPYAAITSITLLIGVKESIKMSSKLFSCMFIKERAFETNDIAKGFCFNYIIIAAFMIFGSLINCLCSYLFADILLI